MHTVLMQRYGGAPGVRDPGALEAALFAATEPMSVEALAIHLGATRLGPLPLAEIRAALGALSAHYAGRGINLVERGGRWHFQTAPDLAHLLRREQDKQPPAYLGRHIVTSRMLTPIDFRDRLLSAEGAAFALEPQLFQSAWFRPHNQSEELPGLYLVGAGTHPGAGLPGVISSAKIIDHLVPDATAFVRGARG